MHDDADEVQRYLDAIRGDHTMPRRLAACPHPITRASALFRLLRERVYCGDQIALFFARRTVAHLPCKTYSHHDAQPSFPSLAYLDLSEITQQRRAKLEGPSAVLSPQSINTPSSRRAQKLLRRLTPADPFEDPYLFALLVAIAQAQHRWRRRMHGKNGNEDTSVSDSIALPPSSLPPPPTILLVTRPGDTTWLHIYTSNIPDDLSDRLDYPSLPPPIVMTPVTIYRRQLTFKPYETLPQRLAAVVDGKWQGECPDPS